MVASLSPDAVAGTLVKRLGLLLPKRSGLALALWGEPGVGKSWVAAQVLRQVPCLSASAGARDGAGQLLAALPRPARLPAWVEGGLERLARGQLEPARAADTLAAYLADLAPFVLLVEDLHEAAPEQQALWLELAQEVLRARGVGLLFTSR
ncbi:ATP-binding protein, partial [Calidithermus chliarophilus]|uniref:ATP-binding protein n=1 Tax=Calidithermus chliarophilus TaxID=52023 RepID=UPI000568E69B